MTDTTMQGKSGLAQGIERGGVIVWKHQCAVRRSLSHQITRQEKIISPGESSGEREWHAQKAWFLLQQRGAGGEARLVTT